MASGPGRMALALAVLALGVAAYALFQGRPRESDLEGRLGLLEDRLAQVERRAQSERNGGETGPMLRGAAPEAGRSEAASVLRADPSGDAGPGRAATDRGPEGEAGGSTPAALRELVDAAVEKKAAQIETNLKAMENKKPSIEVFARTLGLSEDQRASVARAILGSQHEIKALLETPAEDGTVFLDELVDIMAEGMARPGEKSARGMKFFGRLLTENVPGTGETYAARAEAVKTRLRESFQQTWSPEQYARFAAWKMDPTEVQEIPDSPWKAVESRVIERAQRLGAEIPGPR